MSKLECRDEYRLKRIFAKAFVQGPGHQENLTDILSILVETWEKEFTEDNEWTTKAMIKESLNEAFNRILESTGDCESPDNLDEWRKNNRIKVTTWRHK